MNNKPLVSILMPAKNSSNYIGDCLDSIIKQTYQNWELIIVDDHSNDGTDTVLEEYRVKDTRIQVVKNEKAGIIPALTLAFSMSKGSYITRMDSDDLMPTEKLEKFISFMPDTGKVLVTGKVNYFSNNPVSVGYRRYEAWLNGLIDNSNHWNFIYRECVIASPNWMVHRDCFSNDFEINSLVYPEDYDMVFKWFKAGYTIIGIPEVTHLWREHSERTSRHNSAYQQESFFKLKTNYFLDIERIDKSELQLIGVGVKGKLIANILAERKQNFKWFDYNSEKFKAPIMGHDIQNVSDLEANKKTVLSVWPNDLKLQEEIKLFLKNKGLIFGENLYLY